MHTTALQNPPVLAASLAVSFSITTWFVGQKNDKLDCLIALFPMVKES